MLLQNHWNSLRKDWFRLRGEPLNSKFPSKSLETLAQSMASALGKPCFPLTSSAISQFWSTPEAGNHRKHLKTTHLERFGGQFQYQKYTFGKGFNSFRNALIGPGDNFRPLKVLKEFPALVVAPKTGGRGIRRGWLLNKHYRIMKALSLRGWESGK